MQQIAQIVINLPIKNIDKVFSYTIPEEFSYIGVGWRVIVPFNNRKLEGFIVDVLYSDQEGLKPIIEVLDDIAWFDEHMLAVAKWIKEYYLCTLGEALRLFIPGKTGIKSSVSYTANTSIESNLIEEAHIQEICDFIIKNGSVSFEKLRKRFGKNAFSDLQYLLRRKLIVPESIVEKRLRPAYKTVFELANRQLALEYMENLKGKRAQLRLLEAILEHNILDNQRLEQLGIRRDTVNKLAQLGVIKIQKTELDRNSYGVADKEMISGATIRLTAEQSEIFQEIEKVISGKMHGSFLLHGVTGSGKTQVYIESVAVARKADRQAVVLVPEIALTGQIVARFRARFGNDVVVIHSKLSVGERYDAWRKLRLRQAGIVIGARSAVFAPLDDLGLIILDEEHEFTYKQEESPYYNTKLVALTRGKISNAAVIMGSATPLLETYYEACQGIHKLLNLSKRIDKSQLPTVTVVDMRQELQQGRREVISLPLRNLLTETLENKEQAIILLNRRGYSTFVLCRECGQVIKCQRCEISMVYHSTSNHLRCHYCAATHPGPDTCPNCSSRYIRFFGTGTQKLEEELATLFPTARIVRMDQDTTGGKLSHDRILQSFSMGEYDILLGTQMVAKGHDIKNVTAVGIITADSMLNIPDFRSAERTFSLLTQAAGRAGRGDKAGRVIIQTYNPDHYAIQASKTHDYCSFYQQELALRQSLSYPPLQSLIKIVIYGELNKAVNDKANTIAQQFQKKFKDLVKTEIIGPFVPGVAKIKDVFRIYLLIKTSYPDKVKLLINEMGLLQERGVLIDIDPLSLM